MTAPLHPRREPITVTRTTLPPLEEYVGYLKQIWESHWLTNNGPLVRELEKQLRDYLASPHLWYVTNCTTALQLAVKALGLRGEIITTPFSYVATTGVILWEQCSPVFADIRRGDLTIDPVKIEEAITPRTCAILATHVYGFPCAVAEIEAIARQHGLKVIYDAAHAFGCRLDGHPLATFGDISCLSFHATKVFHTGEGGAVVINGDPALAERIRLMRAFGHHGDTHHCVGINGKNSELHAALGLCNLPRLDGIIERRRHQHEEYRHRLGAGPVELPAARAPGFEYNYAYFPVLLPSEDRLLNAMQQLAASGVIARRYFHPALNRLPYRQDRHFPVAESAAARVMCLPVSDEVSEELIANIASIVLQACA